MAIAAFAAAEAHGRLGMSVSDERFDGKEIYKHVGAAQAVYEVRGSLIYEKQGRRPVYEIRGNYLYAPNSTAPAYEIRGSYIHIPMRPFPTYSIR